MQQLVIAKGELAPGITHSNYVCVCLCLYNYTGVSRGIFAHMIYLRTARPHVSHMTSYTCGKPSSVYFWLGKQNYGK